MIDVMSTGLPAMSLVKWIAALSPIILVLVLMLALKVSGARAGVIGWLFSAVIVYFVFGGGPDVLVSGTIKGFWQTLIVLYIIWSSMFLYNVVNETGAFKTIAAKFTEMTNGNKTLQLLILGWCFPTFIQGVCGFGVPVAVATPLLIGLGFDPLVSCITALLGHSWGIAFGSLGSMYNAIISVTVGAGDPMIPQIAFWGSILVALGGFLVGLCILHNYGSKVLHNVGQAFAEGLVAVIFLALVMGLTLIGVAFVSPEIGCFVAGAAGLVLGVAVLPKLKKFAPVEGAEAGEKTSWGDFLKAFSAYLFLIVVVFAALLINPVKSFLNSLLTLGFAMPATSLSAANDLGIVYTNAAVAKYAGIKFFTTPGTLIFVTSFIAILYYKSQGMMPETGVKDAWLKTVKQSTGSTCTTIPMLMMAILLLEGGLTTYTAYGIAMAVGNFYPILAPFIALLGGFVTSSGTASNQLFGALQYNVASILGISAPIILGQQSAQAALSNSFSPSNCALGTGVSGQSGREGEILAVTAVYNAFQSLVIGLVGFIMIKMGLGL